MSKTNIQTYSTETFREAYMRPEGQLDSILKSDFGKFFIVEVEKLIRLIKLPVPPIRSTTHTFIYLTDGEAVMTIGSETYRIFGNECLVVPAGQVYSFSSLDENHGYLCNFHNDVIVGKFGKNELLKDFEFLRVWGNPRISLDKQTSKFVRRLLKRIWTDYSENGLTNPDIIQAYFVALLCEINRAYKPVFVNARTNAVSITNRFRELLVDRIKTSHRVSDYASELHITPNHLNKAVRTITGKSPTKWIDEVIVLEAKVLLYQSTLSISEIAAEVGLFDSSYFSRLFKKKEGITPLAFRKMIETS